MVAILQANYYVRMVDLYLHSPKCLYGIVLNFTTLGIYVQDNTTSYPTRS
jgi:hypothetical protein